MAQRSEPAVQTFLFADLSGFTALTEAHGDEQAADLVGGFCVAVRQLLAAHQTQEVKTIGDALMLRTGDAAAARLHADYEMGARVLLGGVSSADLATFVSVLDHVLDRLRGAAASTASG